MVLANSQTATFDIDVAILGGSGDNDITFIRTNRGQLSQFRPVRLDLDRLSWQRQDRMDVFGNYPSAS